MMASVREQMPKGLAYEFIIADGGSTDGTLDYLRTQPDVRLLEDGRLTGAINAFCRAAELSEADYVLMANDDVIFAANSILVALQHLDTHPSCAGVAFADDRTAIVTGGKRAHRTEGIGATLPNGQRTMVTYAQVGLFRRDLAKQVGWWGWRDPIMQKAKTYGGDCYLSARLWELGYTVDPVEGAAVDDLIVRDALRNQHAANLNGSDSAAYYERFPTVHLPAERSAYPIPERMRILYLPVYEAGYPQAANREAWMCEALSDYGLTLELDYLNTRTNLPAVVKAWQPDVILTQIQGIGPKLTPRILADMRKACPTALVVNWNGDAHMDGLVSSAMLDLLRHVDLQTTINAAALPIYEREGIPAAYWQIAWRAPLEPLPDMPGYDVLFQGNWYDYRAPLFKMLRDLPYHVGIYGNDARADGNTHYDFAQQAALYANAAITVGDTFPFQTRAFASNRVFQALRAGAFLLLQKSEALEEYTGLIDGVHYVSWENLDDLRELIDGYMGGEYEQERAGVAAAGMTYVRANFSPQAQLRKLFEELIPAALQKELA
jgi:hypothetical protein